jgi:hypothetical protein
MDEPGPTCWPHVLPDPISVRDFIAGFSIMCGCGSCTALAEALWPLDPVTGPPLELCTLHTSESFPDRSPFCGEVVRSNWHCYDVGLALQKIATMERTWTSLARPWPNCFWIRVLPSLPFRGNISSCASCVAHIRFRPWLRSGVLSAYLISNGSTEFSLDVGCGCDRRVK